MDLFNTKYDDNVQVIKNTKVLSISDKDCTLIVNLNTGSYFYIDEDGDKWVYSDRNVTVDSILGETLLQENEACLLTNMTRMIRVSDKKDIIKMAQDYFSKFEIKGDKGIHFQIFLN